MDRIVNTTEPVTSQMTADIVVIGSGPGGAVTATLCAEAGKSVLLVEEGQNLSLQSVPHFSKEELLVKYRNAGICIAFGPSKIAYVEGRCVGGGSEINRGLYHRAPEHLLDQWRAIFKVGDLSLDRLMPHFVACENTARIEYIPGETPPISTRLRDGAARLGWQATEAPRLFRYDGAGKSGRKQSMSETFVPRFLKAGGRLIADTRATRLMRSGGKWCVKALHAPPNGPSQRIEISTDRIFIACGAVQTPALLRRSGLTKNIGNSLYFHPMLKVVAQFDGDVNNPDDPDPVHQIREFEPWFGMGCSISKRPMLGLAMANHAGHFAEIDQHWRRMGIYYVQAASGRATVRNLPFFRDPLVRVWQNEADLGKLADGLKRLAEALFAAGAVAVYPSVPGYPVLRSMEDVRKLPATFAGSDGSMTSVHVFSSCPMGGNDAICATDSFGRVRDADGLYIADASLLCGPTIVNPQGTVMAIAHRNATHAVESRFN
ncbi:MULTISPECIES: GMC family oxidoreductase [Mesorhizobium]|uniref:Choline dehydrogenase-like flavoprotein n=1 Tax=Rhizobium loti TaxID=381 RepID=A0A8E3B4F3_RHILI|nr:MULTISPECIES: GMC family oxidoreductase [Mesorhizobium]PWJ91315.1 choline dehydrogenase-like flavoprotein [Mesorhizobium loti]